MQDDHGLPKRNSWNKVQNSLDWTADPQNLMNALAPPREAPASPAEAVAALGGLKATTLPTDSNARKEYPLFRGVLWYFPAALAGVARTSKIGNDKHNPGQEMHHARSKSQDHADCILRHLVDTAELLAALERAGGAEPQGVLTEVNQLAWRALAFSQELHERFGAPLAPGAKR